MCDFFGLVRTHSRAAKLARNDDIARALLVSPSFSDPSGSVVDRFSRLLIQCFVAKKVMVSAQDSRFQWP